MPARDKAAVLAKFGMRVRDRRVEMGLSQAGLAALAGCHQSMVSLVEAGQREPSLMLFLELADALEVPVAQLTDRL